MPQCELMESQADVLLHSVCCAQRIEQQQGKLADVSINGQYKRCRERKILYLRTRELEQQFASAVVARSKSKSGKLRRLHGLQHVPGGNVPHQRVGMPRLHVIGDVI